MTRLLQIVRSTISRIENRFQLESSAHLCPNEKLFLGAMIAALASMKLAYDHPGQRFSLFRCFVVQNALAGEGARTTWIARLTRK